MTKNNQKISQTKEYGNIKTSDNYKLAYLPGIKAAVIVGNSTKIFAPTDEKPKDIIIAGKKNMPKYVPWGENNDLPKTLTEKVGLSPVMSANLLFNVSASFGQGVMPVVSIPVGLKKELVPLDNAEIYITDLIEKSSEKIAPIYQKILNDVLKSKEEIDLFFENNDIDNYLLEQFTDMHWFFNCFSEIIFNKETGDKRKIVKLNSKEASFSRLSVMNKKTGKIEYHYYYGDWGHSEPDDSEKIAFATPLLDVNSTTYDLRDKMLNEKKQNSYVIPINFPTPGRNYYQKPYWYSLIESGWYDFAITIPELKKNIIQNQAIIKYIISLDENYFNDIFKKEKIIGEKEQITRVKAEYKMLNDFLTKMENNGKSIVTFSKAGRDNKRFDKLEIKAVENSIKSGEYIEDSEEVSNIMCYAMLIHPSLVGASPGKNKGINGTEARELYLIKQAILKPFINRILKPFNVIKAINGWSQYINFVVPNIELTTLDKNKTGVQTKTEE